MTGESQPQISGSIADKLAADGEVTLTADEAAAVRNVIAGALALNDEAVRVQALLASYESDAAQIRNITASSMVDAREAIGAPVGDVSELIDLSRAERAELAKKVRAAMSLSEVLEIGVRVATKALGF